MLQDGNGVGFMGVPSIMVVGVMGFAVDTARITGGEPIPEGLIQDIELA
jgi:hypothetical protein